MLNETKCHFRIKGKVTNIEFKNGWYNTEFDNKNIIGLKVKLDLKCIYLIETSSAKEEIKIEKLGYDL